MKFINQLKFRIGEQYENYEFQLKPIKEYIENNIHYDAYSFEENSNSILGIKTDKVELHYNADILEKVVYHFTGNQYECLKEQIAQNYDGVIEQIDVNIISWYYENIVYILSYTEEDNVTIFKYNRL